MKEDNTLLGTSSAKTRLTLGDHAFQSTAPSLWNDLHAHNRNFTRLNAFKVALKTHLFSLAFI